MCVYEYTIGRSLCISSISHSNIETFVAPFWYDGKKVIGSHCIHIYLLVDSLILWVSCVDCWEKKENYFQFINDDDKIIGGDGDGDGDGDDDDDDEIAKNCFSQWRWR